MKHTLARDISGEFILLLICGVFSTVAATGISHSSLDTSVPQKSPLQTRMQTLESMLRIQGATVASTIPYPMIYVRLQQYCTSDTIAQAQAQLDELTTQTDLTTAESDPNDTARRFRTVRNMITNIAAQDDAMFCTQKYLTYSLLEIVQGGGVTNQVQNTPETSSDYMYQQEQVHAAAPVQTESIALIQDLSGLNDTTMVYADIAQYTIDQITTEMIEQGFLTSADVANLSDAIEIHYVDRCGTSHGSFLMTQDESGINTFKKLDLNINLCADSTYVYNYQSYVTQLFVHELGHYLYYFKDTRTAEFNQICWDKGTKICNDDEFVTMYARANTDEDYAESFAYRYMTHKHQPAHGPLDNKDVSRSTRLGRRGRYFDDVFGDLLFHD